MDHEELLKELATNLYFQLKDEPPQITEVNKTEKKHPLHLKLRVRKNNKLHLKKNLATESIQNQANCHLASSDDTIMSFKLLLETDKDKENSKKHRNKITKMLRPEDNIPYMPKNPSRKRNEMSEFETLNDYDSGHKYFGLSKNNFIKNSPADLKKHKIFIGKCKPGGCLDPAFSEDNYEYYISKKIRAPEKTNDPYVKDPEFNHGSCIKIANTPNDFEITSWNFKENLEINTIQHIYEAESLHKTISNSHSSTLTIYPTSLSNEEINNTKNMNKNSTESSPKNMYLGISNGTYFTPPRNVKKLSDSKISVRNNSDEVNTMNEKLKSIESDFKQGLSNKIRSSTAILENQSSTADNNTKRKFKSPECELEMPDVDFTFLQEKVHQNNSEYPLIPKTGSMKKDSIIVEAKSISECGDIVKHGRISDIITNIDTNEDIEKRLILPSQETKLETDNKVKITELDTNGLNRAIDGLVFPKSKSQTNTVKPPNTISIENANTNNISFLKAEEIPAQISAAENIGTAKSDQYKTKQAKIVSEITKHKSLQDVEQESFQIRLNNYQNMFSQNSTTPSQDRVAAYPEISKLIEPYIDKNNAKNMETRNDNSKSSPFFSISNRSLNHNPFQKNYDLQKHQIENMSLDKKMRSVDNLIEKENNNLIQHDNENELSSKSRDDIKTTDNFSHNTDLDQDDYDLLPSTLISSSHDSKYEMDTTNTFTNKVQYSSKRSKHLEYKDERDLNFSTSRDLMIKKDIQMQSEKQKENESVLKIFRKELEQTNVPNAKTISNNIIVTEDISSMNIGSFDVPDSKLDSVETINNETNEIESKIDVSPNQSHGNVRKDVGDFNFNKELRKDFKTKNHEETQNTKVELKGSILEINLDSDSQTIEQPLRETSQTKYKDRYSIEPDILSKITIPKSSTSVENRHNIAEKQLRNEKNISHSRHKTDKPHAQNEVFHKIQQVNENNKSDIGEPLSYPKPSASLALKNDTYLMDLEFAIFMNNNNEKTIKTLDTSQTYDEDKSQNLATIMIKSQMRTSNKEIRFPVDSENDLIIQIKKTRIMNQKVQINNTFARGEDVLEGKDQQNEESKNETTVNNNEASKLQNILSWIYNHELVPLQNVIKELKDDIDFLTEQQQHKAKIQQVKKTKSMKLLKFTKDCTCLL
ncbi:uncharacterized protein LOC101738005 isoform X3 [Bombyx mori]|uniref:uncharacterized protein LOC101738005 isoform X3 n=1 Tax=Bombyx mori TaxID=7091 RepID=UPI002ED584DB